MEQKTIGEQRVCTDFNPGANDNVSVIKNQTAVLINFIDAIKPRDPRLAALAMTAYEEAAMWAVKLATAAVPTVEYDPK